jgi:hypothetical protein
VERKWWLVIAGCITHAVNTGFSYFGMSAFFPSFEREFGWSRTAISGAFSLARVESGLLGPIGRSSPAFSMTSPTATRLLSGYLRRLASARSRCCFWLNDRKRQLYRSGFRYRPGDASALRVLAVVEGIAGLLVFGCVISKLVSRRQEELTEEIHRTTFEDRLDRVRTNLHLVFSDFGLVQQLQAEHGSLPGQVLRRLESTVGVFRGELQTIHDLLYKSRVEPDEEALESLLANLVICLQSLLEINSSIVTANGQSASLAVGLKSVSGLANEICGDCVPHSYAPALKESMDQIQELARKIA